MIHKPRILVGDDQLGICESFPNRVFLRNYGSLGEFEFTAIPDEFIEKAKQNNYDALLIDLNWDDEDFRREYKTGFRVLESVREFSPLRILHTSDDQHIEKGYKYGATHCLEKNKDKSFLEEILKGGKEK